SASSDCNTALLPFLSSSRQFACRVTGLTVSRTAARCAGLADQKLILDFGLAALQELCRSGQDCMSHGCANPAIAALSGGAGRGIASCNYVNCTRLGYSSGV